MKIFLLSTFFCAIVFAACRDNGIEPPLPRPDVRELTPLEKGIVASDNAFGLKLFVRVNETEPNKNVFISPFSVSMALGMALNGADGATLDSMKMVLGHSAFTMQEIDDSYKSISALLTSLDPNVTMNIANSVWSREGFAVFPSFLNDCSSYFDAEAASLDFDSPSALQTINDWVNTKTNGKIPTILDFIPSDAMLYLVNAIYYKGTWTYEFDPSYTIDTTFTSPAGSIPCRMMSQRARFAYSATGQVQVVDIPYGEGLFSMTVILPTGEVSIDTYVASLTQEKWYGLLDGLDSADVNLYLPKFKLEYSTTLNEVLKAMGMSLAFDGYADFSRISPAPLFISDVRHKTFVEVNEEGTEAAAVTSVGFARTSVGPPPAPLMRIDRPFIVAIREHASGTILFLGKIVAPTGL
jgi:serine protease inhibitor